jgi:hypothetical protein
MTFRRVLLAAFSTAALFGFAWGCSAADDSGTAGPAGGGSNGSIDASNDSQVIMPDPGPQDSGELRLNPLCGPPNCLPDSELSCAEFTPPGPSEDASSSAEDATSSAEDAGGRPDATGEGGAGGDGPGPSEAGGGGDGGASGEGGQGGAAGAAAGASGAPAAIAPKYGCHVQRADGAPRAPFSACALAGSGAENAPCLTASDCQAGLGCVGDRNTGLCQKYCCQNANDCPSGSYCAERPMRDGLTNALPEGAPGQALLIPVCIQAANCDLRAPYPCSKGSECACESGTACLVVRSDGTTTCAVPGKGKVGDACPCAWGHVCSAATNQCLELCYTRDSAACGEGKCQSASELPDGWGVCVGVAPSGG